MKAVLVGVGGFGYRWYETIKEFHGDLRMAVVDIDESKKQRFETDGVPFYTSVLEAIQQENPDLLINVTPPDVHSRINHLAFDYKIPVFCEKPIADNYADAIEVVERAEREGIPFMISENYRAFIFIRRMKQLIYRGAIGDIKAIHCEFNRYVPNSGGTQAERRGRLEAGPVHHFDLLRYMTDREVEHLYASHTHCLYIWMGMQDGVTASFRSLRSKGKMTDWAGNWRIDGTLGSLELIDNQIYYTVDGEATRAEDSFKETYGPGPFSEFLLALLSNREPETSGRDYLKNQALAHYTLESIRNRQVIDTTSSWR